MRDPFEVAMWRDGASRLNKEQAKQKLNWLVHVAINRKAGIPDEPINHRGGPARRGTSDYDSKLRRDFRRLQDIRRRIRVYQFETTEVRQRFGDRLARYDE
jgi:hypothetical protein